MTIKRKVLFVCIHNSARSQMAEAFVNQMGGDTLTAESAGIQAGRLNPNVVAVMKETGIDISCKQTTEVSDLLKENRQYDAMITVCDAASAERCPVFPGNVKRIAWSYPDPSTFTGTQEEILQQTRQVRDAIKESVAGFVQEASDDNYWL